MPDEQLATEEGKGVREGRRLGQPSCLHALQCGLRQLLPRRSAAPCGCTARPPSRSGALAVHPRLGRDIGRGCVAGRLFSLCRPLGTAVHAGSPVSTPKPRPESKPEPNPNPNPKPNQAVQALREGHQEGTLDGLHPAVFLARAAERARRGGSDGGGSADPDRSLLVPFRSAPGGSTCASERIAGKRKIGGREAQERERVDRSALSSRRVSSSGLARALPLYEAALALRPSVPCASPGTTASYQGEEGEVAPQGTEEMDSKDRRLGNLRDVGEPDLGEADSALLVRERLALTEQWLLLEMARIRAYPNP